MFKKAGWPLLSLLLSACVTINIYFPAAAAEEAARVIVRDVLKSGDQAPQPAPQEKQGAPDQSSVQPPDFVLTIEQRCTSSPVNWWRIRFAAAIRSRRSGPSTRIRRSASATESAPPPATFS